MRFVKNPMNAVTIEVKISVTSTANLSPTGMAHLTQVVSENLYNLTDAIPAQLRTAMTEQGVDPKLVKIEVQR